MQNQLKLSHTEWRKLAKKARRKRIRRQLANLKEEQQNEERRLRENSPTYKSWLEEQEEIDRHREDEERRLASIQEKEWIVKEKQAQIRWRELQEKLQLARERRAKQNELIRQEWEFEQKRLKDLKALKEKEVEEKRKQQEELINEINNFIKNGGDIPDSLKQNLETNPNKEICPFFRKTGACRFKDTCSRNHIRPGISKILLIPNFYSHYSLEKCDNEHGNDTNLEFESYEVYNHFKEFFDDVITEMERHGSIRQFKVCCNTEPHLRGNVYVEYSNCHSAIKSYKIFQGRWYGGKQLNVEFCNIESWKNAVCGQFYKRTCPKGNACNFLHVFRNPNNRYSYVETSRKSPDDFESANSSRREWRWSESPERISLENGTRKSEKRAKSRSRSNSMKRLSKRNRSNTRSSSRRSSRRRSSSRRSSSRSSLNKCSSKRSSLSKQSSSKRSSCKRSSSNVTADKS